MILKPFPRVCCPISMWHWQCQSPHLLWILKFDFGNFGFAPFRQKCLNLVLSLVRHFHSYDVYGPFSSPSDVCFLSTHDRKISSASTRWLGEALTPTFVLGSRQGKVSLMSVPTGSGTWVLPCSSFEWCLDTFMCERTFSVFLYWASLP